MKWPWNHFTLLIRYQRLTGVIETYLGWAASWNSGRWKSPLKPSIANALSTAERTQKFAAKHHGIYEIPLVRIPNIRCVLVMWSNPSWNRRTGCAILRRFPVNSAHFDLFTVAKVCQLHNFSFCSQILYLQVGIAYGSCLYSWAYGAGDFVPCDPTYNIHTPWNCHNWF